MTPLTREQARAVDKLAVDGLGIPGIVLMENAGINAVSAIHRFMAGQPGAGVAGRPWPDASSRAVIFCGGGNNGGDGFVSARHLHNRGANIHIIALKPPDQLTGDAAINARICQNMGLDIRPASAKGALTRVCSDPPADLLIDALLGTGFTGELRPDLLELIQAINATKTHPDPPRIIAIDIPSGLDCDTGQPPGHSAQNAVRADLTVTFVAPKLGFSKPAAKPYLGEVVVADIGAPQELIDRVGAI
jgi:NAD(P)H-hydrate epimerase